MALNVPYIIFVIWLAAAFVAGLLVARIITWRIQERPKRVRDKGEKAFFQGIQHLLSNEPDQAIEQFTKSIQVNSDTVETYVALGNLYSSKGDIERAIRIRQGIILRPNLDKEIRLRAMHDLGLDYKRGGFLDRALSIFQEVLESDPSNIDALEQVERIYQDMNDWEHAFQTRQALSKRTRGDHLHILAHHQTELGKSREKNGDIHGAEASYKKALLIYNECIDAHLHLGDLYLSRQEYKKALSCWRKVAEMESQFTFLAYERLEKAYARMENIKSVEEFLQESAKKHSDAFSHLAIARFFYRKGEIDAALDQLNKAITLVPSFLDARRRLGEILLKEGRKKEALSAYKELLMNLDFPYLQFRCRNCGYTQDKLVWKCPQCLQWDSVNIIRPTTSPLPEGGVLS